jgi:hypothetical protein
MRNGEYYLTVVAAGAAPSNPVLLEGGQTLERRTKKISRKQRFGSARTKSDASIRRKPRLKAERRARLKRGER